MGGGGWCVGGVTVQRTVWYCNVYVQRHHNHNHVMNLTPSSQFSKDFCVFLNETAFSGYCYIIFSIIA